jgi:hypothetical protein
MFLAHRFSSARSVRNYVSGVRFMHKALGLQACPLNSFLLATMLRAEDLTLRNPSHIKLTITPRLLHKLCLVTFQLGHMSIIH